jgi:PAS domain S-box-containing protein
VTLLLTLAATRYVAETGWAREQLQLEGAARQAAAAVNDRVQAAVTLLRSTSGLFAARGVVRTAEFHSFVARLALRERYPGIQGIGYSYRVRRGAVDSLRRSLAAQGVPDFEIWPQDSLVAERHAVVYLEPEDRRNLAALGYDMFTEPARRDAMLRAWESGSAAATGRVTLVQEIDADKQAGFLVYVPVYRGGQVPQSVAERRESLLGFVYSPFRTGDLLSAVFQGPPAEAVDVWAYDGTEPDSTRLLYASNPGTTAPTHPDQRLSVPLDIAGRPWLLVFAAKQGGTIGQGRELPPLIFVLGVCVSVALAGVTRAEVRARSAAERAALEQRRSEEAVRQSEQRFRFLADFIPTLVWAARPDGTMDYVNRRACDYFGVTEDRLLAAGWWHFVHPDDLSGAAQRWNQAVRTGEPYETEYRIRRADGAFRWHLDRGAPLRDEQGRIERWFGTCTDMDDQRRAQEALRQAQKLESIGVLAGGIAHDFNNLLTGISGNASLALGMLPPAHRARPLLEDALRAGERAASLTAQLLAYAGKGRFFLQPVDMGRLIEELTQLIRATIPRKVGVRLELERGAPQVRGDASQLQQLIMNLVINGAEAIGDAVGTVTVRVRPTDLDAGAIAAEFTGFALAPGHYVRVEVEDTGCGMDEATLAQIFDPFFTTKFTGRGLGLAAALGIVRGHGGAIAIRTAPGQGSRFTFVLPGITEALPAEHPAPSAPPAPLERVPGAGLVLLADDEAAIRRIGLAALEEQGYDVLLAEDGRRALELALSSARVLRLVILDLTMPELSGAEVARRLRALQPELPILMISGYGEQETIQRLEGVSVEGFISKPFTDKQLAAAVSAVVRG